MKRSNTSVADTATPPELENETSSEPPKIQQINSSELPKRHGRRRCMPLDLSHNRDVFKTIIYRIWMYRKRHILTTILQLVIPPMILYLMTSYLGNTLTVEEKGWSHYDALDETQLQNKICGKACENGGNGSLAAKLTCYMEHKNTKFYDGFTGKLRDRLSNLSIELKLVNKRDDILKTAIQHHLQGDSDKYIGGIEVQNPKVDAPNSVFGIGQEFQLQSTVYMAQKVPGFRFARSAVFFDLQRNDPKHYYQLLGIQLAVFRTFYEIAIAETGTNISQPLSIDIQSLSYPNHTSYTINSTKHDEHDVEFEGIDPMLATIFVLSLVPVFYTVVEGPVLEKENGFKLYLQLMGLPRGAYWFHWILNQMIVQLFVIGIQVYLIFTPFSKAGALVRYGHSSLWVVLLILYNFSSLSFFVFIAAFCRRGKMATSIGILIWLLSFHMLQSNVFDFSSSFSLFMVSCLIPCGCIHWAVYILATVNSNTWDVILNFSLTQKSGFKLVDVMIMMIVNFFIYFLLTLYVDNLSPGPQEVGQPWNYFFENLKCRFFHRNRDYIADKTPKPSRNELRKMRKNDPNAAGRAFSISTDPVIEFKRLSKKFYMIGGVFELENVQFTIYQGITVLLGHKDSGRTTLFRLICGAYAPTSGTVLVFNYNVRKEIQRVQSYLNVCMESDMICEYLTVMEHMKLIAKLKGVKGHEVEEEIKSILESLGLDSQRDDLMYRLAKWQRRVLCVAMSLIGDAPILLLDEPTAGLDLDSKRQIWNLLKELRMDGKTIVISTHNVEEAYQIADRIVIMSRGRVAGAGSPAKLENLFETGYHLTVGAMPDAKADAILAFLQQHVPGAREREGSLKRVHKAIQVENWDSQSQTGITLLRGIKRSKTVISITGAKDTDKDKKSRKSLKTTSSNESKPIMSDPDLLLDIEIVYLLPARERNTFPSLFKALDDGKSALKFGIKYYDLTLHTIENAFDEIDDYVDVLNATGSSQDLLLEDFVDTKTKAIKFLINEPPVAMPEHEFDREKTYCSCWTGVFAIIIKRISHAIGNYRHAVVQILLPIFILLIALDSTNRYFFHDLLSPAIFYNTSLELHAPVVPYRINENDPKAQDFSNYYKKVIQGPPNDIKKFVSFGTATFSSHYDQRHLYKLHDEAVVAADFTKVDDSSKVTALFSPGHRHSGPLSLLLMFNALLGYEIPDGKYSVSMAGISMSHRSERIFLLNSTYPNAVMESGADITLTVTLAFGLYIFASGFVTQPCAERICNLKRFQMYNLEWNGIYWIATSIIDLFFNILQILLLALVIYYAPGHNVFSHPQFIILFVITGTLGAFSSILASYNWSHYWPKIATSYYVTLSVNHFFGLFIFLYYTIINYEKFGKYVRQGVIFVLQCVQPFTVPWNFYEAILWATFNGRCRALNPIVVNELCASSADNITNIIKLRKACCIKGFGENKSFDFLWSNSRPDIIVNPLWSNIAFLSAHCVGGVLILMYMESRRMRRKLLYLHSTQETPPAIINSSNIGSLKREEMFVKEELPELEEQDRDSYFRVESLSTAIYKRTLLYPMSFVAEPGKPLVIVGPETAGITVLFEILAGLRAISEGFVSHGGYSLFSWGTRKKFLQHLGLCPSEDMTLDKLTGSQMLFLFARLRGIPSKSIQEHVDYWVEQLGLETKITKQCGSYSLAFKRKLTVALAVIGNPPVLIFEEPTKDLDPLSRTQVLKVIDSLCAAGRIIVILTHNLANVQTVCSKLIIVVNGQMQFCDKAENIYEEIAEEFTLPIKLKGDANGRIDFKAFQDFVTEIETEIESMTLQEEQSHLLLYRVKNAKYTWASLFETIEKVVVKHPEVVLDYYLRKTSIEDVYNSYAVKQRLFRSEESAWEEFLTTYC